MDCIYTAVLLVLVGIYVIHTTPIAIEIDAADGGLSFDSVREYSVDHLNTPGDDNQRGDRDDAKHYWEEQLGEGYLTEKKHYQIETPGNQRKEGCYESKIIDNEDYEDRRLVVHVRVLMVGLS